MRSNNNPELNRRRFLEYFAAVGISSAVMPSISSNIKQSENTITIETIAAAEKLIGIEFTDEERKQMLKGLVSNLKRYRNFRDAKIPDHVNPSMVFNPVPPGMKISKERKPVKFSKVKVNKPNRIEDVVFYSVLQLAKLIETGQITSTELTKIYLARLKKYNPRLHFVVNLTEKLALKQAKRADEEIQSGKYRGLLHGIPYGIKDIFSVKGYPTTWGSAVFKDRIIDEDASVVRKLEEAGAVLLAKLSMGTLASGSKWFGGETKNPWQPRRASGGSSAGPGSATAAGCVAFSIGTETNGSMVGPCNECGLTGLRPTFGRISRHGAMTVSWTWDKVTPICRTVEDCAVVFNAIYGPDGYDNTIIDLPFNWDTDIDIRKLRIGYHRKYFEKKLMGNPKDADSIKHRKSVRKESKRILDFLRGMGINLIPLDFELPHKGEGVLMLVEAAAADELIQSNLDYLVGDQEWMRRQNNTHRFVPAVEFIQASRYRSIIIKKMNEAMKDIDVYVEITWSNNASTNLTGHPTVIVPCGFISENRPNTAALVGKLFGEAELLAVAKKFQDATDFHLKHPEL